MPVLLSDIILHFIFLCNVLLDTFQRQNFKKKNTHSQHLLRYIPAAKNPRIPSPVTMHRSGEQRFLLHWFPPLLSLSLGKGFSQLLLLTQCSPDTAPAPLSLCCLSSAHSTQCGGQGSCYTLASPVLVFI